MTSLMRRLPVDLVLASPHHSHTNAVIPVPLRKLFAAGTVLADSPDFGFAQIPCRRCNTLVSQFGDLSLDGESSGWRSMRPVGQFVAWSKDSPDRAVK